MQLNKHGPNSIFQREASFPTPLSETHMMEKSTQMYATAERTKRRPSLTSSRFLRSIITLTITLPRMIRSHNKSSLSFTEPSHLAMMMTSLSAPWSREFGESRLRGKMLLSSDGLEVKLMLKTPEIDMSRPTLTSLLRLVLLKQMILGIALQDRIIDLQQQPLITTRLLELPQSKIFTFNSTRILRRAL